MNPRAKTVLSLVLISILCCAATAHAQQWGRWYVKADAGGQFTSDTELKSFFGPVDPGSTVVFDPGGRFGVAGGYLITDWFSTEFETGIMANSIHSISGAEQVDASFANFPLLVNVRLQAPPNYRVIPYVGAGVGGSISLLDAAPITLNGITLSGTAAGAVFAWQAFTGLQFRINDAMSLGLEFHYFGTLDPEMSVDFVSSGISSDSVKFGRINTYNFSVVFQFRF